MWCQYVPNGRWASGRDKICGSERSRRSDSCQHPQSSCNYHSVHFSFRTRCGHRCYICLKSEHVPPLWDLGVDVTVYPIADPDDPVRVDMQNPLNYGPNKYFPSGPVCSFREKEVPTLIFTSPNGSISGVILVQIFTYLDSANIYERGDNHPQPCAVVDGHDSRLSNTFLDYIDEPDHKWNFALGVPYLTHLWQVGDSIEQNGSFETAFSQAKDELLAVKLHKGWPYRLEATDIIPLINKVWVRSFARVRCNRKAIADRGWYSPTKKVFMDPFFFKAVKDVRENVLEEAPQGARLDTTETVHVDDTIGSVNVTEGYSANVMDKLMIHAARCGGTERRFDELFDGARRQEVFQGTRKITLDILLEKALLSSHLCLPREGHLEAVYRIFSYLENHNKSNMVFDPTVIELNETYFNETNWSDSVYGNKEGDSE